MQIDTELWCTTKRPSGVVNIVKGDAGMWRMCLISGHKTPSWILSFGPWFGSLGVARLARELETVFIHHRHCPKFKIRGQISSGPRIVHLQVVVAPKVQRVRKNVYKTQLTILLPVMFGLASKHLWVYISCLTGINFCHFWILHSIQLWHHR